MSWPVIGSSETPQVGRGLSSCDWEDQDVVKSFVTTVLNVRVYVSARPTRGSGAAEVEVGRTRLSSLFANNRAQTGWGQVLPCPCASIRSIWFGCDTFSLSLVPVCVVFVITDQTLGSDGFDLWHSGLVNTGALCWETLFSLDSWLSFSFFFSLGRGEGCYWRVLCAAKFEGTSPQKYSPTLIFCSAVPCSPSDNTQVVPSVVHVGVYHNVTVRVWKKERKKAGWNSESFWRRRLPTLDTKRRKGTVCTRRARVAFDSCRVPSVTFDIVTPQRRLDVGF